MEEREKAILYPLHLSVHLPSLTTKRRSPLGWMVGRGYVPRNLKENNNADETTTLGQRHRSG